MTSQKVAMAALLFVMLAAVAICDAAASYPTMSSEKDEIKKIMSMNADELLAKEKEEENGMKNDMERLSSVFPGVNLSDLGIGAAPAYTARGNQAPTMPDLAEHLTPTERTAPVIDANNLDSTQDILEKDAELSREADELLDQEKSEESGIASDMSELKKLGVEPAVAVAAAKPTVSLAEEQGAADGSGTNANTADPSSKVNKTATGNSEKWIPYHPNYDLSRPGSRARAEAEEAARSGSQGAGPDTATCVATVPTGILEQLVGDGDAECSTWCKKVAARGVLDTLNLDGEGAQGLLRESVESADKPAAMALLELGEEEEGGAADAGSGGAADAGSGGCLSRPRKLIRRREAERRHKIGRIESGEDSTPAGDSSAGAGVSLIQISAQASSAWSYSNTEGWAGLDKSFAMCGLGAHQSPIDVTTNELVQDVNMPAVEPSFQAGRLQINQSDAKKGKLVGAADGSGGLRVGGKMYTLESVRLHWPSEHHIEGASVDMEVQLIGRAGTEDLAILSFLFKTGAFNDGVEPLISGFSEGKSSIEWNPATLFEHLEKPDYMYYDGSISYPPCEENAHYLVQSEMLPVAESQLANLRDLLDQQPNIRPIMNLGEIRKVVCKDISLTKANLMKEVSQDAASGVEEVFADEIGAMANIVKGASMGQDEKNPLLADISSLDDEIQNNESDSPQAFNDAAATRKGFLDDISSKSDAASDKKVKPQMDPHIESLLAMNKPGECKGLPEADRPDPMSKMVDLSDRLTKKHRDSPDERVRGLVNEVDQAKTMSCGFYQARGKLQDGMKGREGDAKSKTGDTGKFARVLDQTENAVDVSGPQTDKDVSNLDGMMASGSAYMGEPGSTDALNARGWMDVMKNTRSAPARWRSLLDEILDLTGDSADADGNANGAGSGKGSGSGGNDAAGGKGDGVDKLSDALLNGDGNGKKPLEEISDHLLGEGDPEDAKAIQALADEMKDDESGGKNDNALNNKGKEDGAGGDGDDGGNHDKVDRELTAEELQKKVDDIIAKMKAAGHELTAEELEDLEAMAKGLPGRPGKPQVLEASPEKIHIKWSGPNPDFSLPQAGFQILMNNKTKDTVGKDTMEYMLDKIKPEGWMIQVRAINKKGQPGKPSAGITMNVLKPEGKKARRALDRLTNAVGNMPEAKKRRFRPLLHDLEKGLMSQDPDALNKAKGVLDRRKPDFIDPELMPLLDDAVAKIGQLAPLSPTPKGRKKSRRPRPSKVPKDRTPIRKRADAPELPRPLVEDKNELKSLIPKDKPLDPKKTCEQAKKMREDMDGASTVNDPDATMAKIEKLVDKACGAAKDKDKPGDPDALDEAHVQMQQPLADLPKKIRKPAPGPINDYVGELSNCINNPQIADAKSMLECIKPVIANKPPAVDSPPEPVEDPQGLKDVLKDLEDAVDDLEDGVKAGNPKMVQPAVDALRAKLPQIPEKAAGKLPEELRKPLEDLRKAMPKDPLTEEIPDKEVCKSIDDLDKATDPAVDGAREDIAKLQGLCEKAKIAREPNPDTPPDVLEEIKNAAKEVEDALKPNEEPAEAIPVPQQQANPDPDGLDPPPIHLVGNGKDWIEVYFEPVPRADKYELFVDDKLVLTSDKAGEVHGKYRHLNCKRETVYHFKVRAKNDKHASVYNFLDAIIGPPTKRKSFSLPPPILHQVGERVLPAKEGEDKMGEIQVGWSPVANATGYILAVDGKVVYEGEEMVYTLAPVVLHRIYRFRIQAVDDVRDLESTFNYLDADVAEMEHPLAPLRPEPPFLVEHRLEMFVVTWDPVEGAETYDLQMEAAGPGFGQEDLGPRVVYTGPVDDFVRENVKREQRFLFKVRAISPAGLKSEWSYGLLVTGTDMVDGAQIIRRNETTASIQLIAFSITESTISLRWNRVMAAEGYQVVMDGRTIDVKMDGKQVTSIAKDLSCETAYKFTVGAFSANDPGMAWSREVVATTLKCKDLDDYLASVPIKPNIDRLDQQFMLEWLKENSGEQCSFKCISETADDVMDKLGVNRAPAWKFEPKVFPRRHWSYGNPAGWGGKCRTGMRQSPVSIDTTNGGIVHYSDLQEIETFYWDNENTEIVRSDILLRIKYREGSYITLPQFNTEKFRLKEIHVHTPGEHMVDGRVGEVELQFVHISETGRVVMVAVQVVEGEYHPSMAFVEFLPTRQGLLKTDVKLNAADLLPVNPNYFMYEGSLTMPPCAEGVYWAVMATPVQFSRDQLDALIANVPKNNRPLQTLYNRMILSTRLHRRSDKLQLAGGTRTYASEKETPAQAVGLQPVE